MGSPPGTVSRNALKIILIYGVKLNMIIEKPIIAIDSNFTDFLNYIANHTEKKVINTPIYSFINCKPSPWGNFIFNLNINGNNDLDIIKNKIINQELPNIITTGLSSKPKNIEEMLLNNNFSLRRKTVGMIIDLYNLKNSKYQNDLIVKIVDNELDLFEWSKIVVINLFKKNDVNIDNFNNLIKQIYNKKNVLCFLGFYNNIAVSSSFAFIDNENIGGLYFIATDINYRNKGFGSKITYESLIKLKELNINYCILHASELGLPVYKNIGFESICKCGRYYLPT
jgi:hypothetical protein